MCDMQQPGCSVLPETSRRLITLRQVAYTGEEHPRGLFASAPIARGTLVEASPCILIPPDQYHKHLRHTVLEHYLFRGREGRMLMCLGLGSMFNHSSRPNVDYRVDVDRLVISFTTARDVQQGEELFIFYGGKLWFEDRGRDPTGAAPAETPLHEHMDDEATFLRALQL